MFSAFRRNGDQRGSAVPEHLAVVLIHPDGSPLFFRQKRKNPLGVFPDRIAQSDNLQRIRVVHGRGDMIGRDPPAADQPVR